MTQSFTKKVSCHAFVRQLYHFQAEELPEPEHRAMSEHMDECSECAHRLAAEDTLLLGLRGRLREQKVEAPAALRQRVQAALRREAPASRGAAFRAPWLMPLAASILVALFLVPGLGWLSSAKADVITIDRDVTVVDFDCDLAGKSLAAQRDCKHPRHLNALKVGADQYWNVSVDEEAGRLLVVDTSRRGHRLHVRGDLYPDIRTLHIEEFSDLGVASLAVRTESGAAVLSAARFP